MGDQISKKTISVVIPTRDQAKTIDDTIEVIKSAAAKLKDFDVEIVFVNERSKDNTEEVATKSLKGYPKYQVLHTDKNFVGNGKGLGVQLGMKMAKGDYKMFMDGDNSTPFSEIVKFLPYIGKYDMVIGNRYSDEASEPETNWFKAVWISAGDVLHVIIFGYSKYYRAKKKQGRLRQLVARGGNAAFTLLLGQNFTDQRCGFKLFTAEAADTMFPKLNILSWDFETEIYAMAKKYNYSIIQVPVTYNDDEEDSNFRPKDMINAFLAIFKVYFYTLRGDYRKEQKK